MSIWAQNLWTYQQMTKADRRACKEHGGVKKDSVEEAAYISIIWHDKVPSAAGSLGLHCIASSKEHLLDQKITTTKV